MLEVKISGDALGVQVGLLDDVKTVCPIARRSNQGSYVKMRALLNGRDHLEEAGFLALD